ncbi:capsular biosynthesis protein [uncultured Roseibium sp.]|uniref:capsule biosynthesis protein n=1 Tax=uncultured Roseibium sp. TaxID=1936171 RepID=UPI0026057B88|nr:capsular biosynthesis protein [uncultured Roseibium sp.]
MSGAADDPGCETSLPPSGRAILFLQGPLSPFYRQAGEALRKKGFRVHRLNFCAGDWLHWHGEGSASFKSDKRHWPDFISEYLRKNQITDLVLHGDQRLYHRIAIEEALKTGVFVAVTELGALRPGWMTLERNGLSTLSHFPVNADEISEVAKRAGDVDLSPLYPSSFWLQTGPDVAYNLTNVFLKALYPNYQQHTIYPPVIEYLRGALRLISQGKRDRAVQRDIDALRRSGKSYFLLPLQLEGDFQLRRHSPYDSFADVIDVVFRSFAKKGSQDDWLVLKTHPLDVGFVNWRETSLSLAAQHGLSARVLFLDGGKLSDLFAAAQGVVTLNSTAGVEALQAGLPVKTLVPAHYDIDGLTHQDELESFWQSPQKPDPELLDCYIRALAATTQIRGSIHNREGTRIAAENLATRIANRKINPLGAFVDPPPRLKRAQELGVPL